MKLRRAKQSYGIIVNYSKFFSFFYFLGLFAYLPVHYFYHIDDRLLYKSIVILLLGYLFFIAGYRLVKLCPGGSGVIVPRYNILISSRFKIYSFICFLLSSVSIYILMYKGGGIQERYELSYQITAGMGPFFLMVFLYLYGLLFLLYQKPSLRRLSFLLVVAVVFGLAIFFATGGKRRFLFIGVSLLILGGSYLRLIRLTFLKLCTAVILALLFLLILTVYRYRTLDLNFDYILYWFTDSFSSYSAYLKIIDYIDSGGQMQFLCPLLNHISSAIPRIIWKDKPTLVMNSGNYYTHEILNYPAQVTLSPTLEGSAYLMGGVVGVFFTLFLVGIILSLFDRYVYRSKSIHYLVFYNYFILNVFGLVREGFEVFLLNFLYSYFTFIFIIILGDAIYNALALLHNSRVSAVQQGELYCLKCCRR